MKRSPLLFTCVLFSALASSHMHANPSDLKNVDALVVAVNSRATGAQQQRSVTLKLKNRRGQLREQSLSFYRQDLPEKRQTALFYRAPSNVKNTALLMWDYQDEKHEDDQWLYLPSFRKVRRIAGANRGDYFLNTDLTYDDIKNEGKLVPADFSFEILSDDTLDGRRIIQLQGTTHRQSAVELGYSRVLWSIDSLSLLSRKIEMWDQNGNLLKTVFNERIEQVQGIWSVLTTKVVNHKTHHETEFIVNTIDYQKTIPSRTFRQNALSRAP